MANNTTELVFILDRSGSMAGLESDTIGGFNAMLDKQKQEQGEGFVTTVLFDDRCETLHDRRKLSEMAHITDRDYTVRGCTALLDAMGSTITHIRSIHQYIRPEDVPAHTVFVITTDGMENASHSYTLEQVRGMIQQQKEAGWEFLFLGANIDALQTAASMGIREDHAAQYMCDAAGTQLNFEAVSCAVSSVRANCSVGREWKKRIEEDFRTRSKKH